MPPEAEPVMPASTVTVTASLTSGLGIALSAAETAAKPGNSAITPPNPYSEAVLRRRKQSPGDRRLAAIRESCKHRTPGEDEYRQYAKEQRALDAHMAATGPICVTIEWPPSVSSCLAP